MNKTSPGKVGKKVLDNFFTTKNGVVELEPGQNGTAPQHWWLPLAGAGVAHDPGVLGPCERVPPVTPASSSFPFLLYRLQRPD